MNEATVIPAAVDPILETPRLVLREIGPGDAEFIRELMNEPSFIRNIGDRGLRSSEGARRFIEEKMRPSYAAFGYGLYLVCSRDGGTPLGICGLVRREGLDHPDIGFAFLERFCGRGYAFESAKAVLGRARTVLGLDRILGVTSRTNPGSIRLLEKLGLRFSRTVALPGVGAERMLFQSDLCGPGGPKGGKP